MSVLTLWERIGFLRTCTCDLYKGDSGGYVDNTGGGHDNGLVVMLVVVAAVLVTKESNITLSVFSNFMTEI